MSAAVPVSVRVPVPEPPTVTPPPSAAVNVPADRGEGQRDVVETGIARRSA